MSCRVSKRLKRDEIDIAERLTRLGERLRHALGDRELMPYRVTSADIDVIQLAAQVLTMNEQKTTQPAETQLTPEQIDEKAKREAVKAACQDAAAKGGLDFVAQMYHVPASDLRRFMGGDDTALTESQIEWLAVDLRK